MLLSPGPHHSEGTWILLLVQATSGVLGGNVSNPKLIASLFPGCCFAFSLPVPAFAEFPTWHHRGWMQLHQHPLTIVMEMLSLSVPRKED